MSAAIDHGSRRMLESSPGLASVQVEVLQCKVAEGAMWQLLMGRSCKVHEAIVK